MEQVVIFGTDGGAGVAVGDLVGGLVDLLIGNLGGVEAMVSYEDALQAVQNDQPGRLSRRRSSRLPSSGVFILLKVSSGWLLI